MIINESLMLGCHVWAWAAGSSFTATIATASRTRASNVATIVTATPHRLLTGNVVTLTGLGGTGYNQVGVPITRVNDTTFTYANSGLNESTTADTGGTVTHSGVVGVNLRPPVNATGWEDRKLDRIQMCTITPASGESEDIWAPSPGQPRLAEEIVSKPDFRLKFQTGKLPLPALEHAFNSGVLSVTGTTTISFQPNTGTLPKVVWLKGQKYDQAGVERVNFELWGRLKLDGDLSMELGKVIKPQFEFRLYDNALNLVELKPGA